jgi:hypothetical protein
VRPIFYARSGIPILVRETGQFHRDIPKCQTVEIQKLDDVALLGFHRSDIFQSFTIYVVVFPIFFPVKMGAVWALPEKKNPRG